MKNKNRQLTAIALWLAAGTIWTALAALRGFQIVYLVAAGTSFLAGATALVARRRERRSRDESEKRGPA